MVRPAGFGSPETAKTVYPENCHEDVMVKVVPLTDEVTAGAPTMAWEIVADATPFPEIATDICPPAAFPLPLLLTNTRWKTGVGSLAEFIVRATKITVESTTRKADVKDGRLARNVC